MTSLLVYLLGKKIVDYAVVAAPSPEGGVCFRPQLVNNTEDLLNGLGSKYVPIPQNYSLKDILSSNDRFAFVGLPCHIHGIIKAGQNSKEVLDRIKITISLFCGGVPSINATKYLLRKLGLDKEKVIQIKYRGKGWPGNFTIATPDKIIDIPYRDIKAMGGVFSSMLYRPFFCSLCGDPFGRLADVSTGDAWLAKFKDDTLGRNVVISRADVITDILMKMKNEGSIYLEKASEKDIIESNIGLVKAKIDNLYYKIKFFEFMFGQSYKTSKGKYKRFSNRTSSGAILVYMTMKKCFSFLNKPKYISVIPLFFIKILKIFNYLERR